MTRYVVDAPVALRLVEQDLVPAHDLVAPALLKSQVLALVHADRRRGALTRPEARALLERFAALKIRYLSDRVSRAVALDLAEELDLDDPAPAEYLAVTRLQADGFVTLDPGAARRAAAVVPVATWDDLVGS